MKRFFVAWDIGHPKKPERESANIFAPDLETVEFKFEGRRNVVIRECYTLV